MKNILLLQIGLILFSGCSKIQDRREFEALRNGFNNPPVEAKPRALWPWVDGNFDLEEITHEMEEAKKMGMGGFDIWDVWKVVDEENKIKPGPAFMSDEYLVGICHAINEAERLGLSLGLIISSGWNAGGIWTQPEHQTMGIFSSDTTIHCSGPISILLKFPELPALAGKQGRERMSFIPLNESGLPVFYKTIAVLALNTQAKQALIPGTDIIDLTGSLAAEGLLNVIIPEGKWKIIWYICTDTGEPMIASTTNSAGPMIDHFNPEATEYHINYFIQKLEKALKKPLAGSGLSYLYTDSYEVRGSLWTPAMTDEFERRKGYSLIPFLPALSGLIVEDSSITGRFLFDYTQVLSDLIIESHYARSREICESHGIGFVAEAAGPGMPVHNCPFESLKSSGVLTFPRGEFWHIPSNSQYWLKVKNSEREDHYLNQLQVIKGVASASHIYDQKYVEAESFTGTHLWNEGPGDLKPTLDRALCEGLNRVIFHTWPHTPKNSGKPGWVYAFGTIVNENRIWWPMAKPFMDYIGRSSFMLQEGNFVGDVLFYYGDKAPNFAPPKSLIPALGFGYDYDYINTDVLLNRLNVENGYLTLPNGQKYKLLVLPESQGINPRVLEKIAELVSEGAIVSGPKPERSQSLQNWKENDSLVRDLADSIWGMQTEDTNLMRNIGKGKIYSGKKLRDILLENNVIPDVELIAGILPDQIDYIHRSLNSAQIYFIRNTTTDYLSGLIKLRATGKTVETWDPESGEIKLVKSYKQSIENTELYLDLKPVESVFIVISGKPRAGEIQEEQTEPKIKISHLKFSGNWTINFPAEWKGKGKITVDTIKWWNSYPEDDIRFFSGIAEYENYFETGAEIEKNNTYILKLDDLAETAEVYINDIYSGTIWHIPFSLDISENIRPGNNHILIKVANTWANRLCGDAKLPPEERISNTNVVRLPNAWSYPMKDIPQEEYPLINSGISGNISIDASIIE